MAITDKDGENKAAAMAAAVARSQWKKAQAAASGGATFFGGWIEYAQRRPEKGERVLTCRASDPAGEVRITTFYLIDDRLRELFSTMVDNPATLQNGFGCFIDDESVITTVHDHWFPKYWMPCPNPPSQ